MLERSREAALDLHKRIEADQRFMTAFPPELDIVVWAPRAASVSAASSLSRRIFARAAAANLHLALAELPVELFSASTGAMARDRATVTCLRSVLMKPEHLDWVGRIWSIVQEAVEQESVGVSP